MKFTLDGNLMTVTFKKRTQTINLTNEQLAKVNAPMDYSKGGGDCVLVGNVLVVKPAKVNKVIELNVEQFEEIDDVDES